MLADHLIFTTVRTQLEARGSEVITPAVDVCDCGDFYRISTDLPGLEKDAIELMIDKGRLYLRGSSRLGLPSGMKVHALEFSGLIYRLELDLPGDADDAGLSAAYTDGVLSILLPKKSQTLGRRIFVSGS